MVEFVYNNVKNTRTGSTFFELDCGYLSCVSFKVDINPPFPSKTADKLLTELQKLMTVYWNNLYHDQELQKHAHNKNVTCRSYAPSDKIELNSKYIKTK